MQIQRLSPLAVVVAILALASACSTTDARRTDMLGTLVTPQPADSALVPLATYFRELKTVRVTIDGADYTFLFDTAAGRTLLTPEAASMLGCTPRGRDVGYRMTGESVVFRNCTELNGRLSSFPVCVSPVAVFDVNSLLPSELPRLHGVLALDAFRGQVVTLDWAQDVLVVHSAADSEEAARASGVPVRFATGENGAALSVLVTVRSTRDLFWFLIDSGNLKGTLVDRYLLQDGSIRSEGGTSALLQVGDRWKELVQLVEDDINYNGVLGTDFLLNHRVTLDLRRAPSPTGRADPLGESGASTSGACQRASRMRDSATRFGEAKK